MGQDARIIVGFQVPRVRVSVWSMESTLGFHEAKALLEWQIELGVTEAIGDAPVNRYDTHEKSVKPKQLAVADAPPTDHPQADPVADAHSAAASASNLQTLYAAVANYASCDLKRGARNTVFADGNPAARVMIIGEAPGRDEDAEGRPFVGRAGQFLDKMLAGVDMNRASQTPEDAVYITNVLPWRPPQNRDPKPEEIKMMLPFVQRHVDLVNPDIIVLMGNISCLAGLGRRGITRLRGKWTQAYGKPALPMFHPAYLLRSPHAKREAWADLLELRARLRGNQ